MTITRSLKIWRGTQLWVFHEEGKFVGCVGVKIPMTAQQLLINLQLNDNNAPQDTNSLVEGA